LENLPAARKKKGKAIALQESIKIPPPTNILNGAAAEQSSFLGATQLPTNSTSKLLRLKYKT
jgi:hypothetical protein